MQISMQIDRAVVIIKTGGIVVFPTDTVYGLGADIFNREAVDRIYEVKQRPCHLPLPVLLADMEQIAYVAEEVSEVALTLMKHFWPGGLTLVLHKAASVPDNVTAGSDKVAVRIPDHIVPLTIIRKLEVPIVGTSANISDEPSIVRGREVKAKMGNMVDFVVDGGDCPGGLESTVVDMTGEIPVVLRQGIVREDEIKRLCPNMLGR